MTSEPTPDPCPPEFVAFGQRLADAGGKVARAHFRTVTGFERKADDSPVTVADREAEAVMRRLIEETYPGHGIVGEEFGSSHADADYVWVLDPIDGTRGFITGKPLFGVLVALVHRDIPILGIIDQPITAERWQGSAGSPTTLNGVPVRVRGCPDLAQAMMYTSAPDWYKGAHETAFLRLKGAVRMCEYGADCYAFGLLALGFVDLAIECDAGPHDYCALVPVVEGAGGVITDWRGGRLGLGSDGTVLAAGDAALHRAARELLAA